MSKPREKNKIVFLCFISRSLLIFMVEGFNFIFLELQVELQRTLRDNERQEDELNTSRRILEEQERELEDYRDELTHSSRENRLLKQSMGILRDEADAVR
jgi:hypothetical protein